MPRPQVYYHHCTLRRLYILYDMARWPTVLCSVDWIRQRQYTMVKTNSRETNDNHSDIIARKLFIMQRAGTYCRDSTFCAQTNSMLILLTVA